MRMGRQESKLLTPWSQTLIPCQQQPTIPKASTIRSRIITTKNQQTNKGRSPKKSVAPHIIQKSEVIVRGHTNIDPYYPVYGP